MPSSNGSRNGRHQNEHIWPTIVELEVIEEEGEDVLEDFWKSSKRPRLLTVLSVEGWHGGVPMYLQDLERSDDDRAKHIELDHRHVVRKNVEEDWQIYQAPENSFGGCC